MKKFLSLLLCYLFIWTGSCQDITKDTMDFNKEWLRGDAKVQLSWTYTGGVYTITLKYPEIKTPNIKPALFLLNGDTYITDFETTSSTASGFTTFTKSIPDTVFDSSTYYCGSKSIEQDSDLGIEKKTCKGYLAFLHSSSVPLGTYAELYSKSYGLGDTAVSLIRYDFQVVTKLDLNTRATLSTRVKTKVISLPCEGCNCAEQCIQSTSFAITQKVCISLEACTAAGAARDSTLAYIYGDRAYFFFALTPASRTFQIHQLFAAQPRDNGGVESPLDISYLKAERSAKGELVLSLPMGFLASEVGEALSLKFVFKVDGATRFLATSTNPNLFRILQTPVEAVYTSTPTLHVSKIANNTATTTPVPGNSTDLQAQVDDLQKISIGAIIVVAFSLFVNLIAICMLMKK